MKTTAEETLKTILLLALASLAVFLLFHVRAFVLVSLALMLIGIIGGKPARFIAAAWLGSGRFLGKVNTAVLLSVAFFFVLTPLAFLYRIFNRSTSAHFFSKRRGSLFEDVPADRGKGSFERPW